MVWKLLLLTTVFASFIVNASQGMKMGWSIFNTAVDIYHSEEHYSKIFKQGYPQ